MYPDSVRHDSFYKKEKLVSRSATPESVLTWGTSSLTKASSKASGKSFKISSNARHVATPRTSDAPATKIHASPATAESRMSDSSIYSSSASSDNTAATVNSWSSSPTFAIASPLVGHCYLHPVLLRGSWHLLYDVITQRFASQPRCDFNELAVQPPIKYLKINVGHALPPVVVYSRSDMAAGVTLQDVFQELSRAFKTYVPPNVFSAMPKPNQAIATKQFDNRTKSRGNIFRDGALWADFLGPNQCFAGLSQKPKGDVWDAWFVPQ
ncbi:uncharacterized protein EV420DRAFT_363286 [Desarmillaria tabescens]|uniref:DUF6699 domain-containing protein n=1 Tax=Armillaria tabescens TaxID=1929756 RepID=A0AA39KCE2_ARMTA|nr:uncharacterized protein EV420DRAFT_363286 [Desarmillaria tabescens]KAK0458545.1 hypothetical protein EV420DRAFT_363286 [Desarmillaria tabescens]